MILCDALIVGGGPAGSTCATFLQRAGWKVIVLDRARFPRDKVCAGWLTPEVFSLLELDPEEYRSTGLTLQEITSFRTSIIAGPVVETSYPRVVSYAVRRREFDTFLLRRANARVIEGTPLATLQRRNGVWTANDTIEAPIVIGAGGHFCPVARHLRGGGTEQSQPVVAKELEVRVAARTADDTRAPELFFCRDFQGYGWCVRKGDYLNVGIGRRDPRGFSSHVQEFIAFLERRHRFDHLTTSRWCGHAYLASGTGPRPLVADGALLVGDAAGLAYPESGEGIKPAIESGRLAAQVLIDAADGRTSLNDVQQYARAVERLHPPAPLAPPFVRAMQAAVGRLLMRSPTFARHVVLDRCFLRRTSKSAAGFSRAMLQGDQ